MNSQATDTAFREKLTPLVRQGVERARELKQDVLVSVSEPFDALDPIRLFANAEELSTDRWFWEYPNGRLSIAAAGVITGSTYPRTVRFSETEWNHRQIIDRAIIAPEPGPDSPGPIFLSAFSYDPYRPQDRLTWQGFSSSFFLVPRVVLLRSGDRHLLTINLLIGPNREPADLIDTTIEFRDQVLDAIRSEPELHQAPPPLDDPDAAAERESERYLSTLNALIDSVQSGEFEWLTAARRLRITTSELFNVARMVDRLRAEHPEFRTVAASRHGSTFVGLSRDVLASLQGDSLTATCTYGSVRRGDTPELDEALAEHLRNDEQAVEQHRLAARSLHDALEPISGSIPDLDGPEVQSLDEAHVLRSRLQATLSQDASLLKAVAAMHPAPAVTGYPAVQAQEYLREHEAIDRGWIASPFGWFDARGNGEFVAPDRGAMVRAPVLEQQRAYLFSVTSVTSSSDPDQHLDAAENHLATLLASLTE